MGTVQIDPDWLREHYVTQELSTYGIAKIVGCDPKTVHTKLRALGIATRPRGANLSGADNYTRTGMTNPFKGKRHTEETKSILREKASVPKPHLRGALNGMHGRTGAANPNFRGGTTPERQSLYASGEWVDLVREVYRRDQYVCVKCGSPKKGHRGLHAHHVYPWATHPELRSSLGNLVTLCRKCHGWVHSKSNTEREFLPPVHSTPAFLNSPST